MSISKISKQLQYLILPAIIGLASLKECMAQPKLPPSLNVAVNFGKPSDCHCSAANDLNAEFKTSIGNALGNSNYFSTPIDRITSSPPKSDTSDITLSLNVEWHFKDGDATHRLVIQGTLMDKRDSTRPKKPSTNFEISDIDYQCKIDTNAHKDIDPKILKTADDNKVKEKLDSLSYVIAQTVLVQLENKIRLVIVEFQCYGDSISPDLGRAVARMIGGGINLSKKITLQFPDWETLKNNDSELKDITSDNLYSYLSSRGNYQFVRISKLLKQKLMDPDFVITGAVYVQGQGMRIDANYLDIETGQIKLSASRYILNVGKMDSLSTQVDDLASELRQAIELDYLSRTEVIPTIAVIGQPSLSGNDGETLRIVDIINKKLKMVQDTLKFRVVESEEKLKKYFRAYPPENSIIGRQFGADNLLKIRYESAGTEFVLSAEFYDLKNPNKNPIIKTKSARISFVNDHIDSVLFSILEKWRSDNIDQDEKLQSESNGILYSVLGKLRNAYAEPNEKPVGKSKGVVNQNKKDSASIDSSRTSPQLVRRRMRSVELRTSRYSLKARVGALEFWSKDDKHDTVNIYYGLDSQFMWDGEFAYYFPNKRLQLGLRFSHVKKYTAPDSGQSAEALSGFAVLRFNFSPKQMINFYIGAGVGSMGITHRYRGKTNTEVELGGLLEYGLEIAIAKHLYIDAGANYQRSLERADLGVGPGKPKDSHAFLGGWNVPIFGLGYTW